MGSFIVVPVFVVAISVYYNYYLTEDFIILLYTNQMKQRNGILNKYNFKSHRPSVLFKHIFIVVGNSLALLN